MKRKPCTVCIHPARGAVEAELLGGVLSLRTIAGRHGLSSSALHRHRRRHLKRYTVGDVLEPENPVYGDWQRWDGRSWQPCPRPRLEDLIEVHSRPSYDQFHYEHHVYYERKVYRLRKTRRRRSVVRSR